MVITQEEELLSIYREVTGFPSAAAANLTFSEDSQIATLESTWSQKDLDRKEKTNHLRSHILDLSSGKIISRHGPQEVKDELWNKVSPSGALRAVVRAAKDKENKSKQYIEILDTTRKLKTIDVQALELHGKIIDNDGQFGSFEWSSSDGHLLYMAEKKVPAAKSYLDPKAFKVDKDGEKAVDNDGGPLGGEFLYQETWGEQLTEKRHPVICVLDVEAGTVSVMENFPQDVSPGQAVWAPDDAGIVVCGWQHEPFRLGLKHCFQRPSALYYLDLQKNSVDILSDPEWAVRFPRFSPDMSKLVYLDMPLGGGHNQCARLIKIDWSTRERQVVVDLVRTANGKEFSGIYRNFLNRDIWFEDNIHIAIGSNLRSRGVVLVINTDSGSIQQIDIDGIDGSMGLLSLNKNVVVMYCSAPNVPPYLVCGKVEDPASVNSTKWIYPDGQPETLDYLTWSVVQHSPSTERVNSKFESLSYESILCLPKSEKDGSLPPLILCCHGGPNTNFETSFMDALAFFCRSGFAALLVNYRGSTGFGQDSIDSLLGMIGTQDVKDVESAMVEVLAKGVADGNCIFLFGGSHGGFLTTHLVGQYPDTFKAASTRNPVINLVSMYSCTDINDWIFAQAGLQYEYKSLADDKLLPLLWKASPIAYVDQVKTPVMIQLGEDDLRVPPAQGREYWRALKARGVSVRLHSYPGNNHGISNVDAEADCMLNTLVWFGKHIPPPSINKPRKATFIRVPSVQA